MSLLEDEPTAEPTTVAAPIATTPLLRVVFVGDKVRIFDHRIHDSAEVGRAVQGKNSLKLDDLRLSRHHATFTVERARVKLANKSQNGSFLNGVRIDGETEVQDGDVVRLGDTFLVLRHMPDALRDHPIAAILGRAPAVMQLRGLIDVIGPTKATVMLLGETGAGKDVAARALHEKSGRKGPFIAVNCAAIPENLAESQLFGHKSGAFTGAQKDHIGFFKQADGGTLFLDEVGELPLSLQPKLLRVLDEKQVWAVGATTGSPIDVRVVAATNRAIGREVEQGSFRADLFARLAEITVSLPPLRARKEDVLLILSSALPNANLSPTLINALLLHSWPFNVRELMKVATELSVKGQGRAVLDVDLLEGRVLGPAVPSALEKSAANAVKKDDLPVPTRDELERLLKEHKGRVSDVARVTGRSRTQVYRWLEQFGFDVKNFRG